MRERPRETQPHDRAGRTAGTDAPRGGRSLRARDKYDLEYLPAETIRAQHEGATHPTQKSFAGLMLGVTTDDVIPMSDTAREFGLEPVPLEEFAPRLVAATVVP